MHRTSTQRARLGPWAGVVLLAGVLVGGGVYAVSDSVPSPPASSLPIQEPPTTVAAPTPPPPPSTRSSTTTTTRPSGQVPGWTVGRPWGTTRGLTMFRGNPTRTWYGTGPLPREAPSVAWRYPEEPMCGSSVVGGASSLWCGTGWTGQPVVWERPDGVTEVIFGAYDKAVHFLDAETGEETRPAFPVGDIVKGSVTLDPDGYPLLYFGGRDDRLRIVALDREEPTELWSLHADAVPGIWNDDWDGNPVVVDDILYEGGENGWLFAVELGRRLGPEGLVSVTPEVVFQMPGWTDELLAAVGRNVSIESSVAVWEERVYFANSGGRVVGLDVSRVREGEAPVVFDYWVGDDVDATVVVDEVGMLYVAVELERRTERSGDVGQLVKLDPFGDDPLVWGIPVPPVGGGDGGIWATPALAHGHVYVTTHTGRLLAVDAGRGEVVWEDEVGFHAWSSPVVVDDVLLVGTCESAELRAYGLEDPAAPVLQWSLPAAEGCVESTPAVWEGSIFVGSRDGFFRAYSG